MIGNSLAPAMRLIWDVVTCIAAIHMNLALEGAAERQLSRVGINYMQA